MFLCCDLNGGLESQVGGGEPLFNKYHYATMKKKDKLNSSRSHDNSYTYNNDNDDNDEDTDDDDCRKRPPLTYPMQGARQVGDQRNGSDTVTKSLRGKWLNCDSTSGGSLLSQTWRDNPCYRVVLRRPKDHWWSVKVCLSQSPRISNSNNDNNHNNNIDTTTTTTTTTTSVLFII